MANGPTVKTKFTASDQVSKTAKNISGSVKKLAAVAGATFVTGKIAQGIRSFVSEASRIEDAVAGFTPLMGGVQKANDLVSALNETAANTPFQFENISAAAKQLLPVMNQDIEKTVETFRMLGDTAGGNAQNLDSITRGYTKAMLKGKVDMESLNMIADSGVPIYKELANSMGISVEEMMEMSSKGQITSKALEKAFRSMTSEGGIFYNGMDIASKTLSGRLSTLSDNVKQTKAAIGNALLPTIKPLIDKLILAATKVREFVNANQLLINMRISLYIQKFKDSINDLVAIWNNGLLPAALAFVGTFAAIQKGILIWKAYKEATRAATLAQLALNKASAVFTKSNMIVLAISAAIAVIYLMIKHWDKVLAAIGWVWDKMKDFGAWVAGGFLAIWDAVIEKMTAVWDKIQPIVEGVKNIGGKVKDFFQGGGTTGQSANPYERRGLVGRNDGTLSRTESHSSVDVNLAGLPAGSTVRQRGQAPSVNLNYGYGMGGL